MLKCLFKKFAPLRPAALLKGDSNKVFFLENFAKFFRTPVLYLIMLCKKCVLKNHANFTAKFMRTAASGISENRLCLAGCNFIDNLQY